MPTLYIFAISHYCEKARWALDYLNIDHKVKVLAPGLHIRWAKKRGLPDSSLPILDTGSDYIQGSSDIIDWADSQTSSINRLTPHSDAEKHLEIEKRLDDISGVHTRRMFYSEALVEHPATVRPIFIDGLPTGQRLQISATWPIISRAMVRMMNLGFEQGRESKNILEEELDWLDSLLTDGRRYLIGDSFSRADLTASSLYARIASISHPKIKPVQLPPRTQSIADAWKERPFIRWVQQNYAEFR